MLRIHPLYSDIEKPARFTYPFCYEPHPLCLAAAKELQIYIASVAEWRDEIASGKMFGVLVVERNGGLGYLAAYSGLLCGRNDWPFFVPAVFDLLQPGGRFKKGEEEISAINSRVATLESDAGYVELKRELSEVEAEAHKAVYDYKEEMKRRKSEVDGEQKIRTSQFLNAELRRIKKGYESQMKELRAQLQGLEVQIATLRQQRKHLSDELQHWLFSQYRMLNARGEWRDLNDIFANSVGRVPPSGAGECCAPKLLQYAYEHSLRPVCMAEFWWGASPKSEVRHHLCYYPACRGKCKPILEHMLQGLDIDPDPRSADEEQELITLYDDDAICVVCKPAGMLSVPGKSVRRSVLSELKKKYPSADGPMIVHRLDMDTSGLMVVAKSMEAYLGLQRQFCSHSIRKRYVALLSRMPDRPKVGTINLPLCPDEMDRPRQIVDYEHGKESITDYIIEEKNGKVIAHLFPRTGRTHQLRIHCAHPSGLNAPIVGDALYGNVADRLYLHAEHIEFVHPIKGEPMDFDTNDYGFEV